jgi:N-acetylglucosamine-6-phosphate deacetylase
MLGITIPQAVKMISLSPAAVLGLDGYKGRVRTGYDADLVLFDDDIDIKACIIAGRCCYIKNHDAEVTNAEI